MENEEMERKSQGLHEEMQNSKVLYYNIFLGIVMLRKFKNVIIQETHQKEP